MYKRQSCILISTKEQQDTEKDYYQNTLGFSSPFLFAETLEEARLIDVYKRQGLDNAIKLANTYPHTDLILIHWGTVDAPDMDCLLYTSQNELLKNIMDLSLLEMIMGRYLKSQFLKY